MCLIFYIKCFTEAVVEHMMVETLPDCGIYPEEIIIYTFKTLSTCIKGVTVTQSKWSVVKGNTLY